MSRTDRRAVRPQEEGMGRMDRLLALLHSMRNDIDFEHETALIDDGLIKSLEVLSIFTMIEREFGIKVPVSKIKPENFNSVDAMWRMIQEFGGTS